MSKHRIMLVCTLFVSMILVASGSLGQVALLGPISVSASGESELGPVSVPVILDGVRHEPDSFNHMIGRFASQKINLRYLLTPEAVKQGVIYVFTSEQKEREFLRKHGLPLHEPPTRNPPVPRSSRGVLQPAGATQAINVFFWQDINQGGDILVTVTGDQYPDLRQEPCGGCSPPNWNDQISSVWVPGGAAAWNWEHINYQGARLTITGALYISDLRPYGWNDIISSIKIFYVV